MLTPKSLVERLIASKIAKLSEIAGCVESEIRAVRESAQLPLPRAYIDFLATVGRGAGRFLRDIDIYYPKMIGLNAEAIELLEDWEEGRLLLPNLAFVFAMRRGEQFLFFEADGKLDDPPVYHYLEGQGHFRLAARSFWDGIESELRMCEDFRRDFPHSPLRP